MQVDVRAVQLERVGVSLDQPLLLERLKQAPQHAALGPAVEPHVDRVPVAELARETAPGAALVVHVEAGVEDLPSGDLEMNARQRQQVLDPRVLRIAQRGLTFHLVTLATPPTASSLSHPSADVNRSKSSGRSLLPLRHTGVWPGYLAVIDTGDRLGSQDARD